ncbi:MAG: hypothetical protein J2P45_13925 [Candidatus Dormibacteraeota bacterium]|nr:hypothetical protein [Candidatus Dormibacteraeota bacterium]
MGTTLRRTAGLAGERLSAAITLGVGLAAAGAIILVSIASPTGVGLFATTLTGWLLLLVLARWASGWSTGRPCPPSVVPGSEPPAVAALLVAHGRREPSAVAAGILDLASWGCIDLEWGRDGVPVCSGLKQNAAGLREFERNLIGGLAGRLDAPGTPVSALVPSEEDRDGRLWHVDFHEALLQEARRRGLVRHRLSQLERVLLMLAALPAAGLFGWYIGQSPLLGALVWLGLAFLAPTGVRPTVEGIYATRCWLGLGASLHRSWTGCGGRVEGDRVRDPLFARAVATGAAPDLVAAVVGEDATATPRRPAPS